MPRARATSLTEVASNPRSRKIWAAVRQISARLVGAGGVARARLVAMAAYTARWTPRQGDAMLSTDRPTDRPVGRARIRAGGLPFTKFESTHTENWNGFGRIAIFRREHVETARQ